MSYPPASWGETIDAETSPEVESSETTSLDVDDELAQSLATSTQQLANLFKAGESHAPGTLLFMLCLNHVELFWNGRMKFPCRK
ncbi:MAG: hypothetical protein R3C11_25515 [Planctomycetaceae bacterium]